MTSIRRMTPQAGVRPRALGAAVASGFAVLWFRWGLASAEPAVLRALLQTGRVLAVLATVLGLLLAWRSSPSGPSSPNSPSRPPRADRTVLRRYGALVGAEVAVLVAGNVALANTGLTTWIPVWVCAIVGLHFLPLSHLFGVPALRLLAAMLTTIAAAALVAALLSAVAPGTVVGTGAGFSLLGFAVATVRPVGVGQVQADVDHVSGRAAVT